MQELEQVDVPSWSPEFHGSGSGYRTYQGEIFTVVKMHHAKYGYKTCIRLTEAFQPFAEFEGDVSMHLQSDDACMPYITKDALRNLARAKFEEGISEGKRVIREEFRALLDI